MTLSGYVRPDGSVGFRNHVAILSSVGCANDVSQKLARMYPNALLLTIGRVVDNWGMIRSRVSEHSRGLEKTPTL
jgi:altronate dehydratase